MDTRKVSEIQKHPIFEDLFPIRPEILEKIEQDMRAGNCDLSQPVILGMWKGRKEPVLIDGHTRLKAAINAGVEELPIWIHQFDSEQEAIQKAIKLQQNRRNLSDAEITVCVFALDSRRARGGDRRSEQAKSKPQCCGNENSRSASAKHTAEILGISPRKVEQVRTVLDHADPETLDAVKKGRISINKACNETQKKRVAPKAQPEAVSESNQAPAPAEMDTRVTLSSDHWVALETLGGVLEEHVGRAVERYLFNIYWDNELEKYEREQQEEFADYDD